MEFSTLFSQSSTWYHCPFCKERGPHVKKSNASDECVTCSSTREKFGTRKFSADNDMDPCVGDLPINLPVLTEIERDLTSHVQIGFKIYQLPSGREGFSGSVINLEKDSISFLNCLPLSIKHLPICIYVRRSHCTLPQGYRDFHVRQSCIRAWLLF